MKILFDANRLSLIKETLLLIGVFFLPIYQTINHWFFGLFMAVSIIGLIINKRIDISTKAIWYTVAASCIIFFGLRVVFFFHTSDFNLSQKELVRAIPFFLYPLGIITLKKESAYTYSKFLKKFFWSLTIGCSVTAIICWIGVALRIGPDPIPANKFFGWKQSGIYLTAPLELHPPYLGMLFYGALVFLFSEVLYNLRLTRYKRWAISLLIIFLTVFLFNLTARNSLIFLVVSGFIFFVYEKKWHLLVFLVLAMLSAVTVVVLHPSQYYRIKLYHMLGLSEREDYKDKRFERLMASYAVFKQYPLMGAGLGRDSDLKITEYQKMDDSIAVERGLNSHNQFFEYLAAYGIVGASSFLLAILTFLVFLIRHRYYFFLFLFLNILLASITESIFERALGIQYYALVVSLGVLKYCSSLREKTTSS